VNIRSAKAALLHNASGYAHTVVSKTVGFLRNSCQSQQNNETQRFQANAFLQRDRTSDTWTSATRCCNTVTC